MGYYFNSRGNSALSNYFFLTLTFVLEFSFKVLPLLLKQPNGLPVQHLCVTIGQSARNKFTILEGLKSGTVENVKKNAFFYK